MPIVDRLIGVLLGLVLGVGIVTAFVFLGSEDTIDSPRIQDGRVQTVQQQEQGQGAGRH